MAISNHKNQYIDNKIKYLEQKNQTGRGKEDRYVLKLDQWTDYVEYVKQNIGKDCKWIYDIIDKKTTDRLLYETENFVLVSEMNMKIGDPETFHLLAFPKDKAIKSIRDLVPEHIPLLKEMITHSKRFITQNYMMEENEIETHFHYPPGVLLLHIHFENVNSKRHRRPLREHSVHGVIENLSLDSQYYKKRSFEIIVKVPSKN